MLPVRLPFRRLSSAFVLVAWLLGLVAPAIPAHGDIDLDCGDAIWLNDHTRTAFEDVRPSVDTGHCELCHLQRALRGMLAGAVLQAALVSQPDAPRRPIERAVRSADRSSLPPRAPPSVLS